MVTHCGAQIRGLVCNEFPKVGSTRLSWLGANEMALRVTLLFVDRQDSSERALRTPGSPCNGAAEPHSHLSLTCIPNAPRINWLETTVPLQPCSKVTVPVPEREVTSPKPHRRFAAQPSRPWVDGRMSGSGLGLPAKLFPYAHGGTAGGCVPLDLKRESSHSCNQGNTQYDRGFSARYCGG